MATQSYTSFCVTSKSVVWRLVGNHARLFEMSFFCHYSLRYMVRDLEKELFLNSILLHVQVLLPFPLFWMCSPRLIFFLLINKSLLTNEITRALSFKPITASHVMWQTEQKSVIFKNTTTLFIFAKSKIMAFIDISFIFSWKFPCEIRVLDKNYARQLLFWTHVLISRYG